MTGIRALVDDYKDAEVVAWVDEAPEVFPVLWRGLSGYSSGGPTFYDHASQRRAGEQLRISWCLFGCASLSREMALEFASLSEECGREEPPLTLLLILNGVGRRVVDRDGVTFQEVIVPDRGYRLVGLVPGQQVQTVIVHGVGVEPAPA